MFSFSDALPKSDVPKRPRRQANAIPKHMRTYTVSLPFIGLVSGTRAIAAAGLALVLAGKLSEERRQGVGWALFGTGLLTTIPLAAMLFGKKFASPPLRNG